MRAETLNLSSELIKRHSITPNDDGCQQLIAERLKALNFEVHHLPFGEVSNLWAITSGTGPIFCFAGHTDVVPPGDIGLWSSPPFVPTITDNCLYGRGAADMKTAIAAMITAVESIGRDKLKLLKGRIAFLITSDEEGVAVDGTKKVMSWLDANDIHLDYCLIGEPSSDLQLGDTIKNGRRGSLNAQLTIHGTQGHIAYPHLAQNPIHLAIKALAELIDTQWDTGDGYFQPTQFQISNIHAGQGATNVIPNDLELLFNLRFSPQSSAEMLKVAIEAVLKRYNLAYTFNWKISGEPFITAEGKLLKVALAAIKKNLNIDAILSTHGGTSDGRFIAPYGVQTIELGVINKSIHKVDEHVDVEDLGKLSQVYKSILLSIFE